MPNRFVNATAVLPLQQALVQRAILGFVSAGARGRCGRDTLSQLAREGVAKAVSGNQRISSVRSLRVVRLASG